MKNLLFLIAISLISAQSCISQINFEKGYYINNEGDKINCLIKNSDWDDNPIKFFYKLNDEGNVMKQDISAVKEFGVFDSFKYVRSTVEIDKSDVDKNNLSISRPPIFEKEQLFLKVLVEGKASLYYFKDSHLTRFFFKKEDSEVTQLIYKLYLTDKNKIGENNRFRQQLWNDLKCPNTIVNKTNSIDYNTKSLIKYFIEYNTCNNAEYVALQKTNKKGYFNLSIRPGLNSSSLETRSSISNIHNLDFPNELGLRLGVEIEYFFPVNKNKWSIIVEPTYRYYKTKDQRPFSSAPSVPLLKYEADYSSIEIPIGIRHYLFLNDNASIFLNASFVLDFPIGNYGYGHNFTSEPPKTQFEPENNYAFGLGFNFIKKYSLEFRYFTTRELLKNWHTRNAEYRTVSLIFGYTFL